MTLLKGYSDYLDQLERMDCNRNCPRFSKGASAHEDASSTFLRRDDLGQVIAARRRLTYSCGNPCLRRRCSGFMALEDYSTAGGDQRVLIVALDAAGH